MSVCAFPGCTAVRKRAGFPSPPCAVIHISNWPTDSLSSVLFSLSVFAVFSLSTFWLCRQTGRPRLTYCTGLWKKPLQAKSEQNGNTDGRRLSDGFMENMFPHFPSFACCLIYHSSCFCSPKLSVLMCYPSLLPQAFSQS